VSPHLTQAHRTVICLMRIRTIWVGDDSRGRFASPAIRHDLTRSDGIHIRRESVGVVYRSRVILTPGQMAGRGDHSGAEGYGARSNCTWIVAAVGGWRTAALRGLSLQFESFQLEPGGEDSVAVYSGVVEAVPGEVASRTVWTLEESFSGQRMPYTVLTDRRWVSTL
jgi:hypothetical protein